MAANKEHPLQRTWTLYFDGGGKAAPERPGEWKAMATVCTFNSVETFWRLFSNIVDVTSLDKTKKDFFLFVDGIRPDWDDPANASGGQWLVHLDKCKAWLPPHATVDSLWRDTVMAAIGDQFSDGDDIVGVALNLRRTGARLAIWTRSSAALEQAVGTELKAVLGFAANAPPVVGFESHADAKVKAKTAKFYWSGFQGNPMV